MVPERDQCTGIGRHGVVVEVAADDPSQPLPLRGDRLVHALPHLLFNYNHLELRLQAVRPGHRISVAQALERIRKVARERKKERFTALFHHISTELLETIAQ